MMIRKSIIRTASFRRGAELDELQLHHVINSQAVRRLRIAMAIEAATRKSRKAGRRTGPASQDGAVGAATHEGERS